MVICDLCDETKECFERQIEGRKYDICADCWHALATKLKGKGRISKEREIVLLPPSASQVEPTEPNSPPGYPPKIWGGLENPLTQNGGNVLFSETLTCS